MKQIFSKETSENTVVLRRFKHSPKSKIDYCILVLLFIGIFTVHPYFKVEVHSLARGIIKPNKDGIEQIVINSGHLIWSYINISKQFKKRNKILVIYNSGLDDRIDLSKYQLWKTALFVKDLSPLLEKMNLNQ